MERRLRAGLWLRHGVRRQRDGPSLRTCTVSPAVTTELILPQILVSASNTLYGTAGKGAFGRGTIFAVNTDGMGFTTCTVFTATDLNTGTNSDGAGPEELTLSGNTLYGTASGGGFLAQWDGLQAKHRRHGVQDQQRRYGFFQPV